MAELMSAVWASIGATATTTALTAAETSAAVASAGAGAASWAAGTTVTAATSGLWSTVQGALSLGSAVSTLLGGMAAAADYSNEAALSQMAAGWNTQQSTQAADLAELSAQSQRLSAEQAEVQAGSFEIQAKQAEIEARQRTIAIKRDLAQKTGAARVAFAGSGLDISSGAEIEGALASQADYQIGTATRSGEIAKSGALASRAGSLAEAAGRRAQAEATEGKASQMRAAAGYEESMANLKASGLTSKASWAVITSTAKAAGQTASYGLDLRKRG